MKKILLLCFLISNTIYSQLGFCDGSKGDPIFEENFGIGTDFGPELSTGTTNYNYIATGGPPIDGQYTISSQINNWFDWHNIEDHTPNDTNGKMLIVNAAFTAGEFYSIEVSGLCANTTYEFSSWLINVSSSANSASCGGNPHNPVNVTFQILDSGGVVLASGNTGNIPATNTPNWEQYGLVFTTTNETEVTLKMINNGTGGCGNDLGIDDILFRSCGDLTTISSDLGGNEDYNVCEDQGPTNINLQAVVTLPVYDSPEYLWQESSDGVTWTNTTIMSNTYTVTNIITDTYYRVRVAENSTDLNTLECSSFSSLYKVSIVEIPAEPTNPVNVTVCEGESISPLSVNVESGYTANWYTTATGGTPVNEESTNYNTSVAGTYYVEATHPLVSCISPTRTPVTLTINKIPNVSDENVRFCQEQPFTISANIDNATYLWSTGATTKDIAIDSPGTYIVTITSAQSCSATKTITAAHNEQPIIKIISSNRTDITVNLEKQGDFEYSLDGFLYQNSNTFRNIRGGTYNVFVRNKDGCTPISQEYIHLEIPFFITPNGDNINDTLIFYGIENYTLSRVSIFDRYGKLIISNNGSNFSWDGTFNGIPLPSSDYWYKITLDNTTILKGHIALKR